MPVLGPGPRTIILSTSSILECGRSALYNSRNAIWAPSHVTIILPAPPPARTHVLADHGRCSHLVLSHYKPLPPFWPPDITPALTTTMFELAALFENPTAFGRSAPYNSRTAIFPASADEPSPSHQLKWEQIRVSSPRNAHSAWALERTSRLSG